MRMKKAEPPVEHGVRDPEADTELFHSPKPEQVFTDDTQDEKETIGSIGDEEISQDGMGVFAAPASDPGDPDRFTAGDAVNKVNEITFITGEAVAAAPASAEGTGFYFRSEKRFLTLIEVGCRIFYTN